MEDSSHNHDQLLTPFQGPLPSTGGFPCSSVGKESAYHTGDLGSIPWSRRSPREGNGNPLQYSCLENPLDRGAWQAIVHGVARVRQDLATKPPPLPPLYREVEDRAEKFKFLIMAWSFGGQGFPGGSEVKNSPAKQETLQVWSVGWKALMEMEMSTHPVFLPGKSHGQRRLAGYSPRVAKESGMTQQLNNNNFLVNSPHPEAIKEPPRGASLKHKMPYCSYHSGNSKGSRSSVPGIRITDQ